MIVSPTRELAKQIHAVAAPFLATLPGVSSLLLVGGTYAETPTRRLQQLETQCSAMSWPRRADLRPTAERSMMLTCWLTACRDPSEDVAAFKQEGGQVLIGTPGRLSDFMKRCTAVDTRRLEVSHCRSSHGSTCCDQHIESQLGPAASWT